MKSSTTYMPQLDAVRAFAAFAVVIHHFTGEFDFERFGIGAYGVELFFVISGFLISKILIEQKNKIPDLETGLSRKKILGRFYIRRILRLFPVYYLFITFFFLLSKTSGIWVWDKGCAPWFYTYTANFLFFFKKMQGIQVNHLWTLAVEEQFYLFWPLLLLFIPKRFEIHLISIFIVIGLGFKIFMEIYFPTLPSRLLTVYHFDTLGCGAFLAWLSIYRKKIFDKIINPLWTLLLLVLWVFLAFNKTLIPYDIGVILWIILTCIAFSMLVKSSANGISGIGGRIFNNGILQYLGKISYGIYIFHKPIPYLMKLILSKSGLSFQINHYLLFLLAVILTLAISSLSWIFLERPISRFKEKFI